VPPRAASGRPRRPPISSRLLLPLEDGHHRRREQGMLGRRMERGREEGERVVGSWGGRGGWGVLK
jgi:hypothetical protein